MSPNMGILNKHLHTLLSSLNIHKHEREKKSERRREGRKERTTPSRAPPPSPSSSSASERESSRMRGNAMEERKRSSTTTARACLSRRSATVGLLCPRRGARREEGGMYRRLRALSRRCRRLELATELLHRLQAVASPLISSLSLLNTIVVSSVTSVELQEFSLGSCPPSVGLQGMRWSTMLISFYLHQPWMEKHFCIHLYPEWPGVSSWLGKLFVRAIQELWQWWSRLLRVVVDTEEEEAVVMVLATAAVVGTTAEAVVEAVTTVGILGFCKGLPNKLSLKNIEKVTRRAQEQFQMVLEEKSRFAFDVDLDAPKVRIPLRSRGSARCDSHFLLDFGHFTLHTAESQSDEQRHNLYSRFYISERDFAAFLWTVALILGVAVWLNQLMIVK
ncbi:hypothetical protein Ahy_A06g030683 [Arachis hypogaea]|uniref:Uncharacterized protein n=2 Tax=Arachis TaxID=3817 RepID=A0A445CX26_ARAHY|nr:hypothetical protein Ahy_A06g030683 [Arachis hypogaea]